MTLRPRGTGNGGHEPGAAAGGHQEDHDGGAKGPGSPPESLDDIAAGKLLRCGPASRDVLITGAAVCPGFSIHRSMCYTSWTAAISASLFSDTL